MIRIPASLWKHDGSKGERDAEFFDEQVFKCAHPRLVQLNNRLEKAWRRLWARARPTDVRRRDLRHSFASAGAGMGESLVLMGALLGHHSTATTVRYAHLSSDPVRAAADRIFTRIAAAMSGNPGEVVPMPARRR